MTFADKYTEPRYIVSDDRRKQIVLSDRGESRRYVANNAKGQRVVVFRVDDGIITDKTEPKCDYAFWTEENSVYFIELKGGDYSKALTQIHNTILRLVQRPNINTKEMHARIVLSNGRAIKAAVANTNEVKLRCLLKRYGGILNKGSQKLIENI